MIELIRYFIRFLRKKNPIVGVPVIIINSSGEILLGKRTEKPLFYPNMWGLPGGLIESGETFEETGKREVKEEMGIEIGIIKKSQRVYEQFPDKEFSFHAISIPLYAKIISKTPKPKDETSEIRWVKPSEIKKMKLAYNHKEILEREGLLK